MGLQHNLVFLFQVAKGIAWKKEKTSNIKYVVADLSVPLRVSNYRTIELLKWCAILLVVSGPNVQNVAPPTGAEWVASTIC